MTTATALESETVRADASRATMRVSTVAIFDTMDAARSDWRDLENQDCFATPFQRFEFLAAWQTNIGAPEGHRPLIVVGYDAARRPLLLLPLAVKRVRGVRVAEFMGGKHATYNMAIMRRSLAETIGKADLDLVIDAIHAQGPGVDIVVFERQPERWHGLPNRFLTLLPSQPSVNECPSLNMPPNAAPTDLIKNSVRRFLRNKKERKLQDLPGYRHLKAETDAEIDHVLEAFFRIKPLRMAAQGLPDIFADPAVQAFVRESCRAKLPSGDRAIILHALESDTEMLAIFAGMADGTRFSTMFGTYTMSANARYSPGMVLTRVMVDYYAERGYAAFDLGVGTDPYKHTFCKDDEPLLDSFIGLSMRGKITVATLSGISRTKRAIKQNPTLMRGIGKVRSLLQRGPKPQTEAQADD